LSSTFITIDEEMQAKDKLSALLFIQMIQVRFNTEVPLKTVWQMWHKLGLRMRGEQGTPNKPKRVQCCLNIL